MFVTLIKSRFLVIFCIMSLVLYDFSQTSKLGVPIKTTVSAAVLEEALNGVVTVKPLLLGQSITRKVLCQYFFVRYFLMVVF